MYPTLHTGLRLCDLVSGLVVMLSTLFPPDPTLTVDNVSLVMKKVEPKQRQQELVGVVRASIVLDGIKRKSHNDLERETAYVDVYVNCFPSSSWEELATNLYRHQQGAAVEEMKSYLPPRGEPCLCSACIYCTGNVNSHSEILRKG